MNKDDVLDASIAEEASGNQEVALINSSKFITLCFFTVGLYGTWWMYKSWKFLDEKDKLGINPAARAIFAIFFAYSLFDKILKYAHSKGYSKSYSPGIVFGLFILLNLSSRLPDPFMLISFFSFFLLLLPFNALNFAIEEDENYYATFADNFSTRQIVLIVCGVLMWVLILAGLFAAEV